MVGAMPNREGKGQLSLYIDETILSALRRMKESTSATEERFTLTRWIEDTLGQRLIKLGFLDRLPSRVERRGGNRKRKKVETVTANPTVEPDLPTINPQLSIEFTQAITTGRDMNPLSLIRLAKELDMLPDQLQEFIRNAPEVKNGNTH